MSKLRVMLDLTEADAALVMHALGGLLIDLEDQGQVETYGFTGRQCQKVINTLKAAQIKHTERRWRDGAV